jgi:hypothetical protein
VHAIWPVEKNPSVLSHNVGRLVVGFLGHPALARQQAAPFQLIGSHPQWVESRHFGQAHCRPERANALKYAAVFAADADRPPCFQALRLPLGAPRVSPAVHSTPSLATDGGRLALRPWAGPRQSARKTEG